LDRGISRKLGHALPAHEARYLPNSKDFDDLVAEEFAGYKLRIGGMVEAPQEFSLADLKAMPKQEQITTHFCIQGWSGVADWGGYNEDREFYGYRMPI
jgi:DMSO/TMAO reductase YedYZ molybdopterin-dependent catalytic subunit